MKAISTDRTDLERGAKDISALRDAGLRYSPVVVVQPVEDAPAEVVAALLARARERQVLPPPQSVEAEVIDVEVVEVESDEGEKGD